MTLLRVVWVSLRFYPLSINITKEKKPKRLALQPQKNVKKDVIQHHALCAGRLHAMHRDPNSWKEEKKCVWNIYVSICERYYAHGLNYRWPKRMCLVLSSFCGKEDVVQGDWRPVAHSAEYTVSLFVEIRGCIELCDSACVHDTYPVVSNNGS